MEYYQQKRVLVIAVVILVLLNVGSMGMIWQNQSKKKSINLPQQSYTNGIAFLQDELGLSDEQAEIFKRLRQEHFNNTRANGQRIRQAKDLFFQSMVTADRGDENINALTIEIGELMAKQDMELFLHFQNLKAVCDESQRERLGKIFHQFMRQNAPPGPGGRGVGPGQGPPPGPRRGEGPVNGNLPLGPSDY